MIESKSNLQLGQREPLEAMIAVPAHASTRQRYLTIEAFQSAGFEVLGLVNEPTAGAVEYARHTLSALSARSPKRYVVVYDLGGGTFDTAAVSLKDRRFDLIGAEGVSALGGNDIDDLIASQALNQAGIDESEISRERRAVLLTRCREAKEALTSSARRLYLDTSGVLSEDEVVLDVAPLYEAVTPLIERTMKATELLICGLREHGIDPDNPRELGAVYLVGGSVQFPAVQRALRARFGRKIQLAPQPHASTAVGLAIAADDEAGIFVREAPTRHFGVWREGEGGREKIFDPIIVKRHGSRVDGPLRIERTYRPAHAVGQLRFVECTDLDEQRTPQGEVTPWDSILFPYDPNLVGTDDLRPHVETRSDFLASEEIVETYEYAATGLIRVRIENRTRGYHRSYVLGQSDRATG
jgi:Ethanolamine utilization protein EutJ (predicted chaperonin)